MVHNFWILAVPPGAESQPESPPSEKRMRTWTGSPMFEMAVAVYVEGEALATTEVGPTGVVTVINSILTKSGVDHSETAV